MMMQNYFTFCSPSQCTPNALLCSFYCRSGTNSIKTAMFLSIGSQRFDMPSVHHTFISTTPSVRNQSSGIYQLLEVPATDLHVPLVLVQTLGELLRIDLTASRSPGIVLLVASLRNTVVLLLLCRRLRRSASEEPTDSMADGGADCYTSVFSMLVRDIQRARRRAYAAVDAICPNKPGPAEPCCCWAC